MSDEHLDVLAQRAIDERIFPGCVLGVLSTQGQYVRALGKPTYSSGSSIGEGSIYDVASLTKTIVTATLMHLLIDEGRCSLAEPVCKYIPEFAASGKDGVLIEHLLSYTVQLASPYLDDWKGDTLALDVSRAATAVLRRFARTVPGESYLYTDATAILLGELIRRLTGSNSIHLRSSGYFCRWV